MATIKDFIRFFTSHKTERCFFKEFERFLTEKQLSEVRTKNFLVLYRALQRFEIYMGIRTGNAFRLSFKSIDIDTLREFESFLENEHNFFLNKNGGAVVSEKYKAIYEAYPNTKIPSARGKNTIICLLVKLRTFFSWAIGQGLSDKNPFDRFTIGESVYGTPYYITIEERNKLYETDLSSFPSLAVQRDIFIFQCLIGCRISDLYKLTRSNIINGAVE